MIGFGLFQRFVGNKKNMVVNMSEGGRFSPEGPGLVFAARPG